MAGAAALAAILATAGCSSNDSAGGDVTLQYWMWDDTQVPAYQQCADDFTAANPSIKIEITQTAWGQYWTNLATQVAAGSAPDVWVDQSSYYPQFVEDQQVENLTPYIEKDPDAIDLSLYAPGVADMWVIDDQRYGFPKDFDTIGLLINKARADAAGLTEADFQNMTWNPTDGGTFEEVIAKLSVDQNGVHGNEPGFDKDNVENYGFIVEWADGSQGQNFWGDLAAMNGFTYSDKNPFGTKFNYDSPELVETMEWIVSLSQKGYAPSFDQNSSLSRLEVVKAGTAGMTTMGSFNQMLYKDTPDDFYFATLPTGPEGLKSATNSLTDSMYAGGKHKDQAWEWIKYLASPACQDVVGETGVVFPAVEEAAQRSVEARGELGLDASVFTSYLDEPDGTFLLPISMHGTEISQIVQDALQGVALGTTDPETALTRANAEVNELFES
jgi:multiple sugar transport system substrate-binding protein